MITDTEMGINVRKMALKRAMVENVRSIKVAIWLLMVFLLTNYALAVAGILYLVWWW